jgi:antitoxin ParD1/3/4
MTRITTLTIRLSTALKKIVAGHFGEAGPCESAGEYSRNPIRRDKDRTEREAFERLRGELQRAFGKPEASYQALTAAEVIVRNRV